MHLTGLDQALHFYGTSSTFRLNQFAYQIDEEIYIPGVYSQMFTELYLK